MFYSYEQLVGRNGKFALVWKLATASQKRKPISKAAILDVSIPDLCKQLVELVPTTAASIAELRSKFSLYLLSQLLYGVTLVFERQTLYLEMDARAAQASIEQIYLNVPLHTPKRKGKGRDEERGAKRPRVDQLAVHDVADLPPVDLTALDGVGVVLYNQITLQEEIPRGVPVDRLDDLVPLTREELTEWNWEAVHSRQSNNGSNEVEKLTEIEEINIMQKEPSQLLEELYLLEHLQEITPIDFSNNGTLIQTERAPEREATPMDEQTRLAQYEPIQLDGTVDVNPGLKKRGPRALRMRDDVTMLSMDVIRENVANFSSTLRSRHEILINMETDKTGRCKDLEDMLKPYPTWMCRPYNKELRHLFKTKEIRKITYDEAAAIDPNAPQARGPASQMWRYEGSTEEMNSRRELDQFPPLDEDLRPMGIAYLNDTPEKNKLPTGLLDDEFQMPPLPPMQELDELEPFGQLTVQSDLEEARRSMGARKSAVSDGTLRDTLFNDEFSRIGRALISEQMAAESTIEAIASKGLVEKYILKGIRNAEGDGASFRELFPPANNSRKRAARGFTVVLEMLKAQKILAQQEEPYGEIFLQKTKAPPPA